MNHIYLDYNATTPVAESVIKVINDVMKNYWGNPSSTYVIGQKAKNLIEKSRERIAKMLGVKSDNIIFTSGGTEASNMAVLSCIKYYTEEKMIKPHVITTSIEHDATQKPLEHLLTKNMIDLTYVKPTPSGEITVASILDSVTARTCFISIMLANNETGVIFPLSELGKCLEELNATREAVNLPRILMHTDAAQAIGKIPVNAMSLKADYISLTGHKFYGPKIGCLIFKQNVPLHPILFGGGQENGLRPGTENTPLIAGLGEAAELVSENIDTYSKHMLCMRTMLQDELLKNFNSNEISINFSDVERLPNTLCVSFPHRNARQLLMECKFVVASTGSACHSSSHTTSRIIKECLDERLWNGTMRLSVGRETSGAQIKEAVQDLVSAFKKTQSAN